MPRRGQGEGSVYQRKDGLWTAVVQLGRDPTTGRRLRRSFYARTQKEALAKRKTFLRNLDEGLVTARAVRREPYTVASWMKYWLSHVIEPEREPTTLDGYTRTIDNHIAPTIGKILLSELTTEHVEAWLKAMRDRDPPVGLRTRQLALGRLRTALKEALVRRQQTGVRFNAAVVARMPRGPKKHVAPPDIEHARALLDAARGHRLEAFITVTLGLGLRRGEALGLRWEDIDFDSRNVQIRRRVSHINHQGLIVRQGTKMHPDQSWTLVMPEMVVDALRAHRARQERLPTGFVFTNRDGTALDPRTAGRFFEKVRAQAGLTGKTLHHLRHDFASLLLAQGVPLWVVSKILRHRSIVITADTYGHLVPELQVDAANTMDSILRPLIDSLPGQRG